MRGKRERGAFNYFHAEGCPLASLARLHQAARYFVPRWRGGAPLPLGIVAAMFNDGNVELNNLTS